jgi:hypothetical protein
MFLNHLTKCVDDHCPLPIPNEVPTSLDITSPSTSGTFPPFDEAFLQEFQCVPEVLGEVISRDVGTSLGMDVSSE